MEKGKRVRALKAVSRYVYCCLQLLKNYIPEKML